MVLFNVEVEKTLRDLFLMKAGHRGASRVLRDFMRCYVDLPQDIIEDELLAKLADKKQILDDAESEFKAIEAIIDQRKVAEHLKQDAAEKERIAMENRTLKATMHRRVKGEELL